MADLPLVEPSAGSGSIGGESGLRGLVSEPVWLAAERRPAVASGISTVRRDVLGSVISARRRAAVGSAS